MIEQIFQLSKGNEKVVEKVVQDDNIHCQPANYNSNLL